MSCCNCQGCNRLTPAEQLLLLAEVVARPRGQVICPVGGTMSDVWLGRVKLALDFSKLPASQRLRAIVEDWSIYEINRQVY